MRFFYFIMRTSEPCSSQHDRHFSRCSIVLNGSLWMLVEGFLGKTSCFHTWFETFTNKTKTTFKKTWTSLDTQRSVLLRLLSRMPTAGQPWHTHSQTLLPPWSLVFLQRLSTCSVSTAPRSSPPWFPLTPCTGQFPHLLVVLPWRTWGNIVRYLRKQCPLQCLMMLVSGASVNLWPC
jgi:hypothetical protein